jgi:5-dehydro-4-deoxyglucarate dehydratase
MKIVGRDSGPVRSPLTDLTDQDMADLEVLLGKLKTVPLQQSS